jgi:hypothetical protein
MSALLDIAPLVLVACAVGWVCLGVRVMGPKP